MLDKMQWVWYNKSTKEVEVNGMVYLAIGLMVWMSACLFTVLLKYADKNN